ncbi:glycosyltransferase [Halobacteriovorax sp. JY17]|uniref:glycosyltransferase n=1 Tax=Halobacteriovorax sp. JY17 TaxID=2014617 RepID=UPI000C584BA6|nr:glycosyltransferase [Halobacteriovorax sp. JY17]PIK14032.1 MAG: hypothetical protein CES88_13695 [Halobacteriovorax sp. JY17]
MSQDRTMLILTSAQNFSWFSMTEIIPEIEKLWEEIAEKNNYKVLKINVDKASVKEIIIKGIKSNLILVTCFNLKISWALKILRTKMEIHAPLKFYVHGMSTVGLWPLVFWEWDTIWNKNDSFIVSCQRDVKILKDKFKNINVEYLPFSAPENISIINRKDQFKRRSFYYIGRISEQKNLHTLLYAFSKHLIQEKSSLLTIFGREDELGSPNMGIPSINYKSYLENLSQELGIEKSISFKGFVPREEIKNLIPEGKKVFISSSLHSDENFGMAVLQALRFGHKAIISNWGGYADFKEHYRYQVSLVDVEHGDFGPYINTKQLITEMNLIDLKEIDPDRTTFFERGHIANRYKLKLFEENKETCDFSFAREIVNIRKEFSSDIMSSKIFNDYRDELYHYFSKKYSSSSKKEFSAKEEDLFPWVKVEEPRVLINDPHKGILELEFEVGSKKEKLQRLVELGCALSD